MRITPPHSTSITATLFCIALLSGCAAPGTSVILLPQPDGRPSAVVMKTKGGERVVDQPFERAKTDADSSVPRVDFKNPADLQVEHPALFDLMPPPAQPFKLFYDSGGIALTPASRQVLQAVLELARTRSGSDIVVIGHTDTVGTPEVNDALSLRRAKQVVQLLVESGFPAEHIEAAGRGMRHPAVPTAEGVDEPRNRRVTILVR